MVSGPAPAQRVIEPHQRAAEQRRVGLVQRRDAGDLVDQPQLQMVLQIFADARLVEHGAQCRAPTAASPGPTPDSSSICGEPIAPADRITSPRQRASFVSPFCRKRTPAARLPSNSIRSTRHPVSSRRLARPNTGLRKPRADDQRRPHLLVDVKIAAALVVAGVEIVGFRNAGLRRRFAERVEDVPAQRADARPAIRRRCRDARCRRENDPSCLRNSGITSSQPQPVRPSWRQ